MRKKIDYHRIADIAVLLAQERGGRIHYTAVAYSCGVSFSSARSILKGYAEYSHAAEYDERSGELVIREPVIDVTKKPESQKTLEESAVDDR